MAEPLERVRRFLRELRRRNVYRVAVTYAVVAFVAFQAVGLLIPSTTLPPWSDELILSILLVGMPLTLVVAWAFELTPDGLRRTAERAAPGVRDEPARAGATPSSSVTDAEASGAAEDEGAHGRDLSPPERSIAVLPFTNMGGGESEQFTQGMHDDLLTRLSSISGLMVISRTSMRRYEETTKALPEIARELGVRWVVEGGVQRVGDQIKVNAQLIDPRTDSHSWAKQYRSDLSAKDLFDIQTEITKEIARALQARLTPDEERLLDRRPTEDLEAYRLYVQGRRFLDRRSESDMRAAIGLLEDACDRDSAYAPAWAALAEARAALEGYYGVRSSDAAFDGAREAADRALTLNPDLAEGHASAGFIHLQRREGPEALRAFQTALELEPSLAQAHRWMGVLLDALGRPGALRYLRRAVELNPMTPEAHADLAGAHVARGDTEVALHHVRRGKGIEPAYGLSHFLELLCLYELERYDAYLTLREEEAASPWQPAMTRGLLALVYLATGETEHARGILDELQEAEAHLPAAWVLAALGESDAAFRALEAVESWGMGEAILVRNGRPRVLVPLRDDPRYDHLIREIGRAWGLNPDGSSPGAPA